MRSRRLKSTLSRVGLSHEAMGAGFLPAAVLCKRQVLAGNRLRLGQFRPAVMDIEQTGQDLQLLRWWTGRPGKFLRPREDLQCLGRRVAFDRHGHGTQRQMQPKFGLIARG